MDSTSRVFSNPNIKKQNREIRIRNLHLTKASDVISGSTDWLYPDWLAKGELTVLVAAPGAGKTAMTCALAAGVTIGPEYKRLGSSLTPTAMGHVLMINTEDDVRNILKPRLTATGANLDCVHLMDTRKSRSNDEGVFSFSSILDRKRLTDLSQDLEGKLQLIVIDPIYRAVDGDYKNNVKARAAYEVLVEVARELNCAVLGIAHAVTNTRGKEPLARVAQPSALREVPRSIILMDKLLSGPTSSGGTHVIVHAKNIGTMDGGFEYRLEEITNADSVKALNLVITGELTGSPEDILRQADLSPKVKIPKKIDIAIAFLRDVLSSGAVLWVDIEKKALAQGITKGTLLLAKSSIGVETKKEPGEGRSSWRLPTTNDENAELSSLKNSGTN